MANVSRMHSNRMTNTHLGLNVEYVSDALAIMCGVARKVNESERQGAPQGENPMDKEWNKLRSHQSPNPNDKGIGPWGEYSVSELGDVKGEARRNGTQIHHARIAE